MISSWEDENLAVAMVMFTQFVFRHTLLKCTLQNGIFCCMWLRFLGTHEWITDVRLHDWFCSDKDKWTVSGPRYPSRWYSLFGMTKFIRDVQSVCLPSYMAPSVASQKFPKLFRPSNTLQSLAHPTLCLEMKETLRYHYELAGANVFSFGGKDDTEHQGL